MNSLVCIQGVHKAFDHMGHKLDVLRRHCAAVGRDYETIIKTCTAEALPFPPPVARQRE